MNRVVISVHGIRTRGVWQKDLAPVLARHGFIPHPLDYGNFSAVELPLPLFRSSKVEWLRTECERIVTEERVKRPSIIAHSLGSLLVANMLEKYQEIKFDKVIFAGSIVKATFDWIALLNRGQINLLENNFGGKDWWPRIANVAVVGAGAAGARGFKQTHPLMISRKFERHGHSDYFNKTHFTEYWVPTLRRTVFHESDQKRFVEVLNLAANAVTRRLGVLKENIRANVFVEDQPGILTIPTGLHYNMIDATKPNLSEIEVSIAVDTGCTGRSFSDRQPAIAIFDKDWGSDSLPDAAAKRINPDLKWIISTPIPDPDDKWGILGIFNVDCLRVEKDRTTLTPLLGDLAVTAQTLGKLFKDVQ